MHIMKLLYVGIVMMDEDEHVRGSESRILEVVSAKYGREKTEELKQEINFLEWDI